MLQLFGLRIPLSGMLGAYFCGYSLSSGERNGNS